MNLASDFASRYKVFTKNESNKVRIYLNINMPLEESKLGYQLDYAYMNIQPYLESPNFAITYIQPTQELLEAVNFVGALDLYR